MSRIYNEDSIFYLKAKIEDLQNELGDAIRVIDVVRKFVQAGQARKERTKAFQKAASIARKGGPSGKAAIKEVERKHPIANDIGDAFDAIEEALKEYDE